MKGWFTFKKPVSTVHAHQDGGLVLIKVNVLGDYFTEIFTVYLITLKLYLTYFWLIITS